MLRNILLPTDGSGSALLAAETLCELITTPSEAHVTIAIAIEPLSIESTDYDVDIIDRQNAKMRERAQAALDATSRIFARKSIAV